MEIMNVKEVAEYLSCSESKIRNMVRDKEIPCFRIGSKLNFNKETINRWVNGQELRNIQNIDWEVCNMIDNKKRGAKIYFISDHEYILLPLHISNKIQYYFNRNNNKNQLIYANFIKRKKVNKWAKIFLHHLEIYLN